MVQEKSLVYSSKKVILGCLPWLYLAVKHDPAIAESINVMQSKCYSEENFKN